MNNARIEYFVGLDLGQSQEYTAVAVVEKTTPPRNYITRVQPVPTYAVRHLERFRMGTSYPEIFKRVADMVATPPLRGSTLIVDQTGVGKAVMEMLRQTEGARRIIIPVSIAMGSAAKMDGQGGWLVPKKDLVGTVQVLLQTRRIVIAESLPDAALLINELINFQLRSKVTASTDPIADWREGVQDDLVFAVGIAVWQAERTYSSDSRFERPAVWGAEEGWR